MDSIFPDSNLLKWILALGGWVISIFVVYLGYLERRSTQEVDFLLKTVAYFEGGTQKRSIGIALIEGLLHKNSRHQGVLVPLLTNQFVYLLVHPDVKNSVHEERNLVRIFSLLEHTPNLKSRHYCSWCEMGEAILRRRNGESSSLVVSTSTLDAWSKALGHAT